MTRPVTRIQARNSETILQAALEVFSTHGFRGATLDQISDMAGLSKPNLLYYFPSKEAMHHALLTRLLHTWLDPLRAMNPAGEPLAEILGYVRRKIEIAIERPAISRLFAMENMRAEPILKDLLSGARADALNVCAVLRRWMEAGKMRQQDPLLLLVHIWAVCEYYSINERQILFLMDADRVDKPLSDKLVAQATQFILAGCGIPD